MSLQSIYEAFLTTPKADALAQDAVLSYITTLVSFSDSGPIIKHLETQRRTLRKKTEKTLNAIADRHGLLLEVETALEFINGGGAYLPGLDDNFLVDQTVVLPIVGTQEDMKTFAYKHSNMLYISILRARSNKSGCTGIRVHCLRALKSLDRVPRRGQSKMAKTRSD